ncbi:hypothetical protein SKAU_G00072880 [Synaphobranchus kaupii]|uniref:Uncharacterized protein n=1 Tax=Synaphobranchus kaupii TaxID=118154 RepID=A0A9Q1G7Z4_SYNKA|nr:hypothetical protein SKAU_G00072880 [Synaphobranchus kaupii]
MAKHTGSTLVHSTDAVKCHAYDRHVAVLQRGVPEFSHSEMTPLATDTLGGTGGGIKNEREGSAVTGALRPEPGGGAGLNEEAPGSGGEMMNEGMRRPRSATLSEEWACWDPVSD